MIETVENAVLLTRLCDDYDIVVDDEQAALLLRHLDLLVEVNKTMNLTRITEPYDAIVRHVLDSLLLLPTIDACSLCDGARFVDIGTGGGFPGIPLGVMRPYQGLLIDSVQKKIKAVEGFIEQLGLSQNLHAEALRAELLAKKMSNHFDVVTARAVAELSVLLEYASPFLKKSGYLVVSKGNISREEFERGVATGEIVGLDYVSRETYELPGNSGHREIIRFKKNRNSKISLPRNVGMAKHKPLVS